jgi:hypothetical protein
LSFAQTFEHGHWCKTDEVYKEAYNTNPEAFKKAERELDEAVVSYGSTARKVDDGRTFYIPVVFHYLHPENENGPERFFGDAAAAAVIRRLNEDFSATNPDDNLIQPYYSGELRGVANIQFVLAELDPDGEPTSGINYYPTSLTYAANRASDDEAKYHTYQNGKLWDSKHYLNFWIVKDLTQVSGGGTILAYATLPEFEAAGSTRKTQSGIIGLIDVYRENISDPFYKHALSHEVGHWLGLRHPFQEDEKSILEEDPENPENMIVTGCNDGDCKFKGDKICDIPQAKQEFLSCARNLNSCPNEPQIDNVTNIMDYRNCPQMFSRDQVTRMRGTLVSYRTELVSWQNLQRTGISDEIVKDIKGKTSVYPNPFSDKIIIEIDAPRDVNACIEIRDLLGRSAYKDCKKKLQNGTNKIEISASEMDLGADGVYLVEIKMEDTVIIERVQFTGNR